MNILPLITWITLTGLSLLFVGGFVLWVYGALNVQTTVDETAPEAEATRHLHAYLGKWFLLYGALTSFAGAGCLLTAGMMLL